VVEHYLAKVRVAGSNLVARSIFEPCMGSTRLYAINGTSGSTPLMGASLPRSEFRSTLP
jgi:hypothetical protein